MRVVITGDRNWLDRWPVIVKALRTLPEGSYVILGDARGVDTLAREACEALGLPCAVMVADWEKHGRAAGPIRNAAMLGAEPDELWWFHDDLPNSKGTRNCVEQAQAKGITTRNGQEVADGG